MFSGQLLRNQVNCPSVLQQYNDLCRWITIFLSQYEYQFYNKILQYDIVILHDENSAFINNFLL